MEPVNKALLFLGILMGFVSVALGAFGAHFLKNRLTPEYLSVFEVGVRYQMYHALAIFVSVWIATFSPGLLAPLSGWLFLGGILLFSGSLYLLALTGIRSLGAITPIGGLLFLAGWVCMGLAVYKPW